MSPSGENLVLEHLRAIRGSIGRLEEDVRELRHRMTAVENQVGNLAAVVASGYASLSMRMDRLTDRVERIERRLEIVPAE